MSAQADDITVEINNRTTSPGVTQQTTSGASTKSVGFAAYTENIPPSSKVQSPARPKPLGLMSGSDALSNCAVAPYAITEQPTPPTSGEQRHLDSQVPYFSDGVRSETAFRRRWRKTPKKTVALSFTLLILGIIFLIVGMACIGACDQTSRGFGYFGVGAVLILPGGYSAFILISYWRGVRGYSPDMLPTFD